jgi:hypothetical protein
MSNIESSSMEVCMYFEREMSISVFKGFSKMSSNSRSEVPYSITLRFQT